MYVVIVLVVLVIFYYLYAYKSPTNLPNNNGGGNNPPSPPSPSNTNPDPPAVVAAAAVLLSAFGNLTPAPNIFVYLNLPTSVGIIQYVNNNANAFVSSSWIGTDYSLLNSAAANSILALNNAIYSCFP